MNIEQAYTRIKDIVSHTPLQQNTSLSERFQANIYLKREDQQKVRSYKLRGAYNMISQLSEKQRQFGVVCASAGNHAQGFAYSCNLLGIVGVVFMPKSTPKQKINQTKMFGQSNISIQLVGDTFDDCSDAAKKYSQSRKMTLIPPFDHLDVIEGQATVGVEVLADLAHIDYLFVPIGGGGLLAGLATYFNEKSPLTQVIGVEPSGAASMQAAYQANGPVILDRINKFVDGAAVKRVGDTNYAICKQLVKQLCQVDEGKVCSTILDLYNKDAIVAEPAGALSIAALDQYANEIKGKNVVCILSGGNNDIDRMQEIKDRSLLYEGLRHYFLISFAQRTGALKDFVNKALGPNDDIIRFEYIKKTNKESGSAIVGVELNQAKDYDALIERFASQQLDYIELNANHLLFNMIV